MLLKNIQTRIYEIRNQKVIMDFDLAEMYEVENRSLKQAVKRNMDRFPRDFMFQLTKKEWSELITNCDKLQNGRKYSPSNPFAFTEQGVAMLSSVLKSKKAVRVNIGIMRAFVFVRQYAFNHKDLKAELRAMEERYNKKFQDISEAINYLMQRDTLQIEQKERKRIGYK
jgi:hypothetical protein